MGTRLQTVGNRPQTAAPLGTVLFTVHRSLFTFHISLFTFHFISPAIGTNKKGGARPPFFRLKTEGRGLKMAALASAVLFTVHRSPFTAFLRLKTEGWQRRPALFR